MGRAGGGGKKAKEEGATVEEKVNEEDSKRIRDLAFSRGILSRTRAHPAHPLSPSGAILRCDGKDIVKKGNRKNKYLFTFPGLVAPVAGGKFGELTHLDTKNPILYIDFPQGRVKLFGTIAYPKNKYLILHFLKGSGSIICEDCFESLVVFSKGWWIGTKEENPEEHKMDWPKGIQQMEIHTNFDFAGGAGMASGLAKSVANKSANREKDEARTPSNQTKLDFFTREPASPSEGKDPDVQVEGEAQRAPIRQSARATTKKRNYMEPSSENEESESEKFDSSDSEQGKENARKDEKPRPQISDLTTPIFLESDDESPKEMKKYEPKNKPTSGPEINTLKAVEEGLQIQSGSYVESSMKTSSTGLKQSTLFSFKSFNEKKIQENSSNQKQQQSASKKNTKAGIETAQGGSSKSSRKRPRKVSSDDDDDDNNDDDIDTSGSLEDDVMPDVTPVKGKKISRPNKITPKKAGPNTATPKSSGRGKRLSSTKQSQKQDVADKKIPGKGKSPRNQKNSKTQLFKEGIEINEDSSNGEEASDDSDEDWVG